MSLCLVSRAELVTPWDRLASLERAGAVRTQGGMLVMVRRLFERSQAMDVNEGVGSHLWTVAEKRLVQLEQRFFAARSRAQAALEQLETAGADSAGRWAAALAAGDFAAIERASARLDTVLALRAAGQERAARLAKLGRPPVHLQRRVTQALTPAALLAATGPVLARQALDALSHAAFRLRLGGAVVPLLSEKAQRAAAETISGHYNPQALVARSLQKLQVLAPGYVAAFLESLVDLEALDALPAVKRRQQPSTKK